MSFVCEFMYISYKTGYYFHSDHMLANTQEIKRLDSGYIGHHQSSKYDTPCVNIINLCYSSKWDFQSAIILFIPICRTLSILDEIAKNPLDQTEVVLVENILKDMIDEGLKRRCVQGIINCRMPILNKILISKGCLSSF